jgi:hypothetical protein
MPSCPHVSDMRTMVRQIKALVRYALAAGTSAAMRSGRE